MASVVCDNKAVAHTTPVYVVINAQPTWNPTAGPRIIDKQLAAMAKIESELAKGHDARSQGIRERLQKAKTFYAYLREKMSKAASTGAQVGWGAGYCGPPLPPCVFEASLLRLCLFAN